MSEIESQTNDLLQLQGQLDKIFDVLEGGGHCALRARRGDQSQAGGSDQTAARTHGF